MEYLCHAAVKIKNYGGGSDSRQTVGRLQRGAHFCAVGSVEISGKDKRNVFMHRCPNGFFVRRGFYWRG